MVRKFDDINSLIAWFQGLSTEQWYTLIDGRLRGLDNQLPSPEIRIDEDPEDIFIRFIPRLNNPENAFHAIIKIYEEIVNGFIIHGTIDNSRFASRFASIILLARFVLVRNYENYYDKKFVRVKNMLSEKAYDITEILHTKLTEKQSDEKTFKRLMMEVSNLLKDYEFYIAKNISNDKMSRKSFDSVWACSSTFFNRLRAAA